MASSDLKQSRKVTTSSVTLDNKNSMPPKGSVIKNQTVTTETEQIENGWLVTKRYEGSYYTGKDKSDYNWFNYCKKWYSKEDPLDITLNDKSLAEAFDELQS